eukprot:5088836-Pyramimonas_sp.AAC.1
MVILQPDKFSVVCNANEGAVDIMPRRQVRALGGGASGIFSHYLVVNPTKRRLAEEEFNILMEELRGGRLEDATKKLAASFAASGASAASGA